MSSIYAQASEWSNSITQESLNLVIRNAMPSDADTIAHCNSRIAEETEDRALDPEIISAGVTELLRDSSKGRYWVAEVNGVVVGQIMVTYEWSDWRNGNLWWIQSVYVLPEHRKQGVFSALYRHVTAQARRDGACGLRLYVERNNQPAQQTYRALGMVDPGYQVMQRIFGES